MAEFKEVLKQRDRMCQMTPCDECKLNYYNNKKGMSCKAFIVTCGDDAEKIIMDWAKEHPIITNAHKFKEVFGYEVNEDNCFIATTQCDRMCSKCEFNDFWDKEYREPKGE